MHNLTLLTDLYELTMMQGYFKTGNNRTVIFDAFHRKNPCDGGYSISCGLDQVIDYINNLHFTEDDITYLRSLNIFDEDFLEYLANFKFTGDIYAIPEGSECVTQLKVMELWNSVLDELKDLTQVFMEQGQQLSQVVLEQVMY